MVVSLFVTPESGILVHDSFPLSSHYELLIGVEIPYYYFVAKVIAYGFPYCIQSNGICTLYCTLYLFNYFRVHVLQPTAEQSAHETSTLQLEASALSTPRDRLQTPAAGGKAQQPTETPRTAAPGAGPGSAPGGRGDLVRGLVARRTMRDWVDLEHAVGNKGLRDSILNFSYFLTIGNMDEALKVMSNVRG